MSIKYPNQTVPRGKSGSRSLSRVLDKNESASLTVPGSAPVNAVAAALTTALAGNNNDLVFTAKTKGVIGNTISIRYVDPGIETATETVVVTGKAIVVTLRSVSSVLSTAAQVKAAIEANAAAHALVAVTNASSNNGTGHVIALAATALTGGVDGTVGAAEAMVYYDGYLYFTPTEATVSTATWVRAQFASF
jgi:hypothetical protein